MSKGHAINRFRVIRAALAAFLAGAVILQCVSCDCLFARWRKKNDIVYAGSLTRLDYTLEQVVILSRHNIRSPLSGGGSLLGDITPHEWFEWSSDPSELSVRGGTLETNMGQYFRQWLEAENLFERNEQPAKNAVRIYSNSKQRTIATARFFSAGLLPSANSEVEYHMEFDKMDPVFTPQLIFVSDEYKADAEKQIREMFADKINGLSDNYSLLADVTDMKESLAWKDGTVTELVTDDLELKLELNAEPGMSGSLKTACSVSDALVLQYYEESDSKKAAFGHNLKTEQWEQISEIKDVYGDVLFTAPLVAPNVAHPLLQEIQKELKADGRKFTFLCGHDSNVGSVLAALGAEEYSLPYTIEKKTPIGCKRVFCRWRDKNGSAFISLDLVYQTTDQLRNATILDLNQSPVTFPITLDGIKYADADCHLYIEEEFMTRLADAIGEYDAIVKEYTSSSETKKAA